MRLRFLPLLLLLAAGCGGGEESSQSTEPTRSPSAVAVAAKATQAAGNYRFSIGMEMSLSDRRLRAAGEGIVDAEHDRQRVTIDLPGSGKMESISDGYTLYMRFPSGLVPLASGKQWFKLDIKELTQLDIESLGGSAPTDPSELLPYLKGAGTITRVGVETIRGVKTTHYRGSIDVSKVPSGASEREREAIEKLVEQTGTRELPYDAWIDGDGLLRKLALEMSSKQEFAQTMTMELYDFGAEVTISLPSPEDVADWDELGG